MHLSFILTLIFSNLEGVTCLFGVPQSMAIFLHLMTVFLFIFKYNLKYEYSVSYPLISSCESHLCNIPNS
jgi:type IV secretory pathway VirB3-like protein